MSWVIEDKIFGKEQDLMIETLSKIENCSYKIIKDRWVPEKVFSRGSVDFVISRSPYLINIDNYTYTYYICFFDELMLNSDFIVLPWWKLKKSKDTIFNYFESDKLFIRPNSGRKIFTGNYITKKWLNKDLDCIESLTGSIIKRDTLVIVSSFKEIQSEYRVALRYGEIIDYCCYNGEPIKEDFVKIEKLIRDCCYYPDTFYIVDIAFGEFGAKILEMNNLFSAGWYDMDYEKIIKRVMSQI